MGGGKKVLKPEILHLKAEVEGAGVGSDPSNSPSPQAARRRSGAGASSLLQTRAGDSSLRPAGQGSPGNALKGQGPEHGSCSAWGTPLRRPSLEQKEEPQHCSGNPGRDTE